MDQQLWLDSRWQSPWVGTRKFLRAHSRWLTVAGTVTVLATFIVKDGYRESLKDLTSSLTQAENEYTVSKNHREVRAALSIISSEVSDVQNEIDKLQQKSNETKGNSVKEFGVDETFDWIDGEAVSLKRLLHAFPADKQYLQLVDAMVKMNAKIRKEHKAVNEAIENGKSVDAETDAALELGMDPTFIASGLQASLMANLSEKILKAAEEEQNHRERIVRGLTKAEYVLYPFGLLIGLVGRLYGVPEAAGSAD